MATHFERQLEALHVQIITMGSFCEKAISLSNKAIRGEDCIKAIFETDREIDTKEREIENLCMRILLHQQPVARDLRRISAALKMITDMERIGDQTSDIAEIVISTRRNTPTQLKKLNEMSVAASKMVRDSVTAYVEKNLELARKVMLEDDTVDQYFDEIREELIAFIKEEQGNKGKEIFDLIMIAKYLERIGDHATNIAEWVEFSITGSHRSGVA